MFLMRTDDVAGCRVSRCRVDVFLVLIMFVFSPLGDSQANKLRINGQGRVSIEKITNEGNRWEIRVEGNKM